jgi:hypothetical protein
MLCASVHAASQTSAIVLCMSSVRIIIIIAVIGDSGSRLVMVFFLRKKHFYRSVVLLLYTGPPRVAVCFDTPRFEKSPPAKSNEPIVASSVLTDRKKSSDHIPYYLYHGFIHSHTTHIRIRYNIMYNICICGDPLSCVTRQSGFKDA